jgi:hypothetical protein
VTAPPKPRTWSLWVAIPIGLVALAVLATLEVLIESRLFTLGVLVAWLPLGVWAVRRHAAFERWRAHEKYGPREGS